jgi:hypothetical protein
VYSIGVYPIGVHLIGMFLTGVSLLGVHVIGGHLMGVHFLGLHLLGVYLVGVYLVGGCPLGSYLRGVQLSGRNCCRSCCSDTSHPGSASAHPTPALAVDAQGGITLGPEGAELGADFCYLGGLGITTCLRGLDVLHSFCYNAPLRDNKRHGL